MLEEFARHRGQYGDVSALPTPVFFYGMEDQQEIAVDIEPGKTLVVRYLALSEPDDAGERRVFFELNGQPRTVKVADRSRAATQSVHPKVEEGNASHVGAPMPGLVVNVSVTVGQRVAAGDSLVSIEAMKMETVIHAEFGGQVKEVMAPVGTRVDTKDLLLVLDPA